MQFDKIEEESLFDEHAVKLVENTDKYQFIEKISNKKVQHKGYQCFKRIADIFFSVILLIPISIIIGILAILVRLDSKGPSFYTQVRVGELGRPIKIIKLRSMFVNAEKDTGPIWAKANDKRITKLGHYLRSARLDELPQIINVLKGDLSFIGPRPERFALTEKFSKEFPGFENRLLTRQGLTGWAQVNGGYELNPREKSVYDIYYIDHQSLIFDLKIIFKTIKVLFTWKGAR